MENKYFRIAVTLALAALLHTTATANVPLDAPWSTRMADSILERQPQGTMIERKKPTDVPPWSYSTSLAIYAIAKAGVVSGNPHYLHYAQDYADTFLDADGHIDPQRYKPDTYKLDDIAPGRLMLLLYKQTQADKYKNAVIQLSAQFKNQPRTADGGFWHKLVYPHQMWLDGIFMGCPFLADAGNTLNRPDFNDEAVRQIVTIAAHARDPKTGLFYHGWDESRTEAWADKTTGLSRNFWGRGVGWFAAGIVETLDNLPADHPGRSKLTAILADLAHSIAAVQDPQTHVWWQVLDQGGREGNYLESSASCMFIYALAKGANMRYIDANYLDVAKSAYNGVIKTFIETQPTSGLVTLKDTCLVAGLGGKPYRDGSYDYYIHEKRGDNDPKGMGPFILASLELEHPSTP